MTQPEKLVTGIPGGVCGVYSITTPRGSVYIGSSKDVRRRWYEHHWRMKNNTSSSPQLDRAYAKYGLRLKFEVIEVCSENKLRDLEQEYIDRLKPTLNVSLNAYCAPLWAAKMGADLSSGAKARCSPVEDSHGNQHESITKAAEAMGCSDSTLRRRLKFHDPLPCGTRFRRPGEDWKPLRPPPEKRKHLGILKSLEERRAAGLMGHSEKAKREKSARTRGVPWSAERRARFEAKRAAKMMAKREGRAA